MRLQRLAALLLGSTLVMTWSGDVQAQDGTDHGLESVVPAELGGRQVDYTFTSGQEAISTYQAQFRDQIRRLVESQGASVADVRRATAVHASGDGRRIFIDGLRFIGTDARAWMRAYSLLLIASSGGLARVQEREVGGKDVLRITNPARPGDATFLWVSDDTAWRVSSESPLPPLLFEAIRRIPSPGGGGQSAPPSRPGELSNERDSVISMIIRGQFPDDFDASAGDNLATYLRVVDVIIALLDRAKELQGPPPVE